MFRETDPGLEGVEQYRGERRRLDPSLGSLVERGIHGDAGPHDVVGQAVADRGDGECFCAGLAPSWRPMRVHSSVAAVGWSIGQDTIELAARFDTELGENLA